VVLVNFVLFVPSPWRVSAMPPRRAAVIGEPIAYRVALRRAPRTFVHFGVRSHRSIRVEWPVLRTLDLLTAGSGDIVERRLLAFRVH